MGKCSETNKSRYKRTTGHETIRERRLRQKTIVDRMVATDVRVVKTLGPKKEREPQGFAPSRKQWEKKLLSLLKANDACKVLALKMRDGADLDMQQLLKLERSDDILLEIDEIISKYPRQAGLLQAELEAKKARPTLQPATAASA
mmetsp:Transcript_29705/g.100035  ORF Transcript_29705/g.100035 Transcript_29705/m.100035 type:complete len:145 (-) Transcript_29705:80-514(-)